MHKVDYLIVGQGIAGSCFALKLLQENKSFLVIDEITNQASSIAAGVYNPVVLYRFALIWQADLQMVLMHKYFENFEKLLQYPLNHSLPTFRIIKDENEIHAWKLKSQKEELQKYLDDQVYTSTPPTINAPLGFTEVKNTGRIDLANCIGLFREYLLERNLFRNEKFDHSLLNLEEAKIQYKDIEAQKIVFCEGFGIKSNPYFNYLPVIGVKGEVLKIQTSEAVPPAIWKANSFLMPIDVNLSYAGSTYNRQDLTYEPTEEGKNEIIKGIKEFYEGDFEIVSHSAAIRPTVVDRRPIIGRHPTHENMYLLNGMGTRGTLLAPAMTEELYAFIEQQKSISPEADLNRFTKKHYKS